MNPTLPISTVPAINSSSFSGNRRSTLRPRTLWFRYIAIINLMLGAWYLQWRIGHSINFNVLWLSIPLLLAEIYSYIGGAIFTIGLWRPLDRQIKSFDQFRPAIPPKDWPTVDIFITCYNEPTELVETTARAALAIDYPVSKLRVYILDDGNSAEMRAMAEKLCIEDLQQPETRTVSQTLRSQHQQLSQRLSDINDLLPDLESAEAFIGSIPATESSNRQDPATHFLRVLERAFKLKQPTAKNVKAQLLDEQAKIKAAIDQTEAEMIDLARCRYIARPKVKGKPHHAKAGNINYAIFSGNTHGEFILTLDADHIPKPQILKRVLGYFYNYNVFTGKYLNNRTALVQTPQDFYNLPPGDPFCHQAHLFYGPIQQGKDGQKSAFYTGTNAILRREALIMTGLSYFSRAYFENQDRLDEFELIGGVSSSSITEDMNTAMRLHGAGWESVYHNEKLAEGLAPDDLSSTLKQRLRWAQGTIQVLINENPWFKPGLSFWQQLQYFQTMYSYFSGFATVVLIVCPIIFFFTGIIPIQAYGTDFALHFFPPFILNRLTFLIVAWGIPARELWRSEQFAVGLFPLFIQAVVSVFTQRSLKFQVTPKQRQSGIYLNLVRPQLAIAALTVGGMVWALLLFALGKLHDPSVYLLNSAWAIYNLCLLWGIIHAAIWQPKSNE